MHSVGLASAVSSVPVNSALVCNHVDSSVSLFVIEILATGSASVAVSLPPLPPPEEVLGGSRQGEAGGQSVGIPGGSRQGEDKGLKPCSDKKSFVSLLYQHAYQLEQISSNEVERCKRIAVQVKDVPPNSWARALIRMDHQSYFRNSEAIRRFSRVNTWMAVDAVQKIMQDSTVPTWDEVYTEMSAPRYKSIMDYVSALRAAASTPSAAFWWPDHSLRSLLVTCCAFHYTPMWQALSVLSIQPQPQWATDALLGTRQGEGSGAG